MKKDDYLVFGFLGLVAFYFAFTWVIYPVFSFVNSIPGIWYILAVMTVVGRYYYKKRNTLENLKKTKNFRLWLYKATNGKYVYSPFAW